jgi:hypothetical protein
LSQRGSLGRHSQKPNSYSLKIYLILAILLLGFIGFTACKNLPPGNPIPEPPKPPQDNYPPEIVGEFRMGGGPVTLTGNRWQITLKSVEIIETLEVPDGGTWTFEDHLLIWRWKIKLVWYDDFMTPRLPCSPLYLEDSYGKTYLGLNPESNPSTIQGSCFPGELVVIYAGPSLTSGEEADNLISYAEIPNYALNTQLSIVYNDDEFLTPKQKPQKIIFKLIF